MTKRCTSTENADCIQDDNEKEQERNSELSGYPEGTAFQTKAYVRRATKQKDSYSQLGSVIEKFLKINFLTLDKFVTVSKYHIH